MENPVWLRKLTVDDLATQDAEFMHYQQKYTDGREQFFCCIHMLPKEYESFLLDYVNTIGDMCLRKLLIACENMYFPEELE